MKTATAKRLGRLPKSYKDLVGMLVPRPIHSEDQAEQVWAPVYENAHYKNHEPAMVAGLK